MIPRGSKMLRYLSLFIIIVTLTGCGGGWFDQGRVVKQIDSTEVSRVIITYSEKLRFEKRLHLEDSVIYYEDRINRIRLDYSSMDGLNLWEGRALLVDVVEEFLDRINGNGLIYPHLSKTPMTASNLEIYITFPSFHNKYIEPQTIGLITLRKGIANYFATNAIDCDTDCWQRRSEYYFQSKNFTEFKRQGEALYKPFETEKQSKFEEERYFSLDLEPSSGRNHQRR